MSKRGSSGLQTGEHVTFAFFVIVCVVIVVGDARAQTIEEAEACWHDAFHFCKTEAKMFNMAAIKRCLINNRDKVSHRCRDVLKNHGA
jgi:hypothetical protein